MIYFFEKVLKKTLFKKNYVLCLYELFCTLKFIQFFFFWAQHIGVGNWTHNRLVGDICKSMFVSTNFVQFW